MRVPMHKYVHVNKLAEHRGACRTIAHSQRKRNCICCPWLPLYLIDRYPSSHTEYSLSWSKTQTGGFSLHTVWGIIHAGSDSHSSFISSFSSLLMRLLTSEAKITLPSCSYSSDAWCKTVRDRPAMCSSGPQWASDLGHTSINTPNVCIDEDTVAVRDCMYNSSSFVSVQLSCNAPQWSANLLRCTYICIGSLM